MDLFWHAAHWHERQQELATSSTLAAVQARSAAVVQSERGPARALTIATFWIDRITHAIALYCGGILLFVMMAIIVVDVAGRYFLNSPLYGSLDMSITLLVLIVAASIGYGGRTGAHVTADVFSSLGGHLFAWLSGILVKFLAAIVTALWCWRMFASGRMASRLGETTLLLNIPFEPIYHALAVSIGLYALVLFVEGVTLALKGQVTLLIDESRINMDATPAAGNPQ